MEMSAMRTVMMIVLRSLAICAVNIVTGNVHYIFYYFFLQRANHSLSQV